MKTRHLNTWIEISEEAYAANLRFIRRLVGPRVELAAVVKSNAYGHGMEIVAELATRHGADSFCVHSLDEAQRLRRAGFDQDVLVMGHVPLERLEEAVAGDFRLVVYNRATVERLAKLAERLERRVRLHLKLETGTHRQGIEPGEVARFAEILERSPRLVAEGVYTHFANIEDTTDHSYARGQLERFNHGVDSLRAAGLRVSRRHAACSAATLLFPETHFEMVRLGVSQYGLWPSRETLVSYRMVHGQGAESALRPVMTWKARLSQVKDVPAGAYVGYGCSYQTTRRSRIAILPVGYSDGYDRRLSNQAHVLVRGCRAPVRGRVCMNLSMVDVTDVPGARLEDEAVLLGRQGEQAVTAADLAGWIGTIHYEVVTRIQPEIPRLLAP